MGNLRASIDIGSNSILLLVVDLDNNYQVIVSESNVTALGKDLDTTGVFASGSLKNSMDVLKSYAKICNNLGIDSKDIIATATEASRIALNSKEFYDEVFDNTGIKVTLLTGEGEAYYSTVGILFNTKFNSDTIFIMDIGGASTEIIKVDVKESRILKSFSMPIGAVRITNWLENGVYDEKLEVVLKNFEDDLKLVKTTHLHCVAGTMTSVANMQLNHQEFDELEVHGHSFSTLEVVKMLDEFKQLSPREILEKFPFLGKRSSTIIGGMMVALNVFDWLGVENVTISTYGLRYGTLIEGSIKDEFIFRK